MAIKDHLKDIDFRTKEERQKNMIPDMKEWYEDMIAHQGLAYSDITQAKLQMLSSILWLMLPTSEYKKLTKRK